MGSDNKQQVQRQTSGPVAEAKPYINQGMRVLQQNLDVNSDPALSAASQMISQRVQNPSQLRGAGTNALQNILSMDPNSVNQFVDSALSRASRGVLPQLESRFRAAGAGNSSALDLSRTQLLGEIAAEAALQGQQNQVAQQMQAASLLPSIDALPLTDISALVNLADIEQRRALDLIDASRAYGSEGQTIQPISRNRTAGAISGGLQGAKFGGGAFGMPGAVVGGLGGALLGGLF